CLAAIVAPVAAAYSSRRHPVACTTSIHLRLQLQLD
uniref:Uncharacterized protein n=1 Tax=Aegilops tauschii subsp. strangulata TaxID=200361 RepID=A0A453NWA1_AEGTS